MILMIQDKQLQEIIRLQEILRSLDGFPHGDPGGTDGEPHGITADGITVQFAELRFNQMLDISGNPTSRIYARNFQFRPTFSY